MILVHTGSPRRRLARTNQAPSIVDAAARRVAECRANMKRDAHFICSPILTTYDFRHPTSAGLWPTRSAIQPLLGGVWP